MKKAERFFTLFFLSAILFFMATIGLRTFTRDVLVRHLHVKNRFTELVLFDGFSEPSTQKTIDWKKYYPFPENAKQETGGADNESRESLTGKIVSKYDEKVSKFEKDIETRTTDYLIFYQELTELAKKYEDFLQWNYVAYSEYNGIVQLGDGYLTTISAKQDMTELSEPTIGLAHLCENLNIDFLYVNAPKKICEYEDKDVSGVTDFANQNADQFLFDLRSAEVDVCDLRELLHEEGLKHHAMFFVTDHHWRPETGLWASRKIAERLNQDYGFHFDLSRVNDANYRTVIYPEWFLGSLGKKVTLARTSPEDFTLLYPKFETNLHYEIMSEEIDADGDYSILYDMEPVSVRSYYKKDPYCVYTYANQPLERITNKDIDEDKRILFIQDSFGNAVTPFLAMGIRHVDSIDLRYFTGSVESLIRETKPDIVIVLYSANTLSTSNQAMFYFE